MNRVAIAILAFPLAALGAVLPVEALLPRLYSSERYAKWSTQRDVPLDGKCQGLDATDALYRNVGSVYIPCEASAGKKAMCTVFSDSNCQEAMISMDRSHYRMFDRPSQPSNMVDYVGGLVQSISCEIVDQSQVVMNTNSHPSTMHVSQCLGDQCTIDLDCHANADIKLHCSQKKSMTCQRARYMYEGDECEEDHQCREGYCTGVNGLMKCMPKRSENSICSISAECTSGTKCCDMAGGARCSRDLCSPMSDITECMNIGGACYDSAACCNGSCLFERSVIEGQCM